jgi:1,2-diacylglycerol 3-beta-galactosyltransferase
MRASDIILCKAGGLIVSESLASGLPLVIVHALPGQEEGNVEYVVENGAGQFCKKPLEVLKTLSNWLKDDRAQLQVATENAEKLGQAGAAQQIAEAACQFLQE